MNKINEIIDILNSPVDIKTQLYILKKKYKDQLTDFIYCDDINQIYEIKNIYIRYIGINGIIGWGGFLFKIDKNNKNSIIYLINKNKKVWKIYFNTNYIFYKIIIKSKNENMKTMFLDFLNTYDK